MGSQEQIENYIDVTENHNEELLLARNATQAKLAQDMDIELGEWIDRYAGMFGQVLNEHPSMLEDLLDKSTHDETIAEIKTRIYH